METHISFKNTPTKPYCYMYRSSPPRPQLWDKARMSRVDFIRKCLLQDTKPLSHE